MTAELVRENHKTQGSTDKSKDEKTYLTEKYGIWEVLRMKEGHRDSYRRFFHDAPKSVPAFYRLVQDIYSSSPPLCILFIFSQLWIGCEDAVKMHFSSQLLKMIEHCLKEGIADYSGVMYFLTLRLAITGFAAFLVWCSDQVLRKLRRRITSHFEIRILSAKLKRNLAQSGNTAEQINVSANQAWDAFQELLHFTSIGLNIISQLTLILHLSRRDSGGLLFPLLCILQPVLSTSTSKSLWNMICIVKKNNEDHLRMEALSGLAKFDYRQDVISNNLQQYILTEYQDANKRLGDVSDQPFWFIYYERKTPFLPILMNLAGELPIVYCTILALANPKQTSFASIAVLQESSSVLARHVNIFLRTTERFRNGLKKIRDLYETTATGDDSTDKDRTKAAKSPQEALPLEDATLREGHGIDFELRNVSFTYPGSQANKEALSEINLNIKSGQFIVLVGANGSGKSTLVKLLLRLYQPTASVDETSEKAQHNDTEGQIFIDSVPASSYSEDSLRRSMAVLSQDNLIYPGFSLGENIGLGFTPLLSDTEALHSAAKKAGAAEVLARMKHGKDTVLDPLPSYHQFNVKDQDEGHPLKKVLEELRRPVEVSGGEKQRIVAARTFMRFNAGKIRFLAVDEPSSALDAEGEELLLDNLLQEREGKTIIFVTHRFGKLTKQADLIVCMKEGKIVESGSHHELIRLDGEYKKLYDIQA
ncbi:P-loop containing nucleoside triphosphate hydrolase protein, partial [Macrolepiota fuliginosa MF-IS2]